MKRMLEQIDTMTARIERLEDECNYYTQVLRDTEEQLKECHIRIKELELLVDTDLLKDN